MLKKFARFWSRGKHIERPSNVSRESIIWAYRLFLDREPENNAVIDEKLGRLFSTRELRSDFINSDEFKRINHELYHLSMSGNEPPMDINSTSNSEDLFLHIKSVWEKFGNTDPHWSVLTAEKFKTDRISETKNEFYASGKDNVDTLFATFLRNDIDISGFKSCIEYGCGVGRVTASLAKKFDKITAYDISSSHLRLAREYMFDNHIENVDFVLLNSPEDMSFPKTDVVFSLIVLQHNPPPIIKIVVRAMLQSLNPGGVAFFQVPTYRLNYGFSLRKYLLFDIYKSEMEMHVLTQKEIFQIASQENCMVVEVLEDGWAGLNPGERSNTFLIQKGQ